MLIVKERQIQLRQTQLRQKNSAPSAWLPAETGTFRESSAHRITASSLLGAKKKRGKDEESSSCMQVAADCRG
eukprot:scaffold1561_cov129-Skeletonema_menzelii.AAC.9